MSRQVRIYVLFRDGQFVDVFASFSEAMLHKRAGDEIRTFDREDY